jgi:hypothetical protein
MGKGLSNQWQHYLIGASGIFLGGLLAELTDWPSFIPALAALVPGLIVWWVMEHGVQWPHLPSSDHRLDTLFYQLGQASAAVGSGVWAFMR